MSPAIRTATETPAIDLRTGPQTAEVEHRILIDLQIAPADRVVGITFGPFGDDERLDPAGKPRRRFGRRSAKGELSRRRHLGGDSESLARSLPFDIVNPALVITEHSFSIWDFGPAGTTVPGRRAFTIPRQQLRSIEPAGPSEDGHLPARVTFIDDSWADYFVADFDTAPDFWKATTTLRR